MSERVRELHFIVPLLNNGSFEKTTGDCRNESSDKIYLMERVLILSLSLFFSMHQP